MIEQEEPAFKDNLFRVKKKNGEWVVVDEPKFDGLLADAHTHLHLSSDPVMALARAGLHGVSFICTVLDVCEDELDVFKKFRPWGHQAAVSMQLMLGRC